jgi:hypothetical protein
MLEIYILSLSMTVPPNMLKWNWLTRQYLVCPPRASVTALIFLCMESVIRAFIVLMGILNVDLAFVFPFSRYDISDLRVVRDSSDSWRCMIFYWIFIFALRNLMVYCINCIYMSKPYNLMMAAAPHVLGSVIIFCSTSGIYRVKCKNKFGNKLYSVISQNWGNKIRKKQ